ncbi:hypothetical protein, partial [Alkalibacillus haloalkaliphilus]|uniref:hypothetical protein n=1 Tax=Alkalibacillus haloalkaliphilus TaxID=94136 RepID=UPI0029360129
MQKFPLVVSELKHLHTLLLHGYIVIDERNWSAILSLPQLDLLKIQFRASQPGLPPPSEAKPFS